MGSSQCEVFKDTSWHLKNVFAILANCQAAPSTMQVGQHQPSQPHTYHLPQDSDRKRQLQGQYTYVWHSLSALQFKSSISTTDHSLHSLPHPHHQSQSRSIHTESQFPKILKPSPSPPPSTYFSIKVCSCSPFWPCPLCACYLTSKGLNEKQRGERECGVYDGRGNFGRGGRGRSRRHMRGGLRGRR